MAEFEIIGTDEEVDTSEPTQAFFSMIKGVGAVVVTLISVLVGQMIFNSLRDQGSDVAESVQGSESNEDEGELIEGIQF